MSSSKITFISLANCLQNSWDACSLMMIDKIPQQKRIFSNEINKAVLQREQDQFDQKMNDKWHSHYHLNKANCSLISISIVNFISC